MRQIFTFCILLSLNTPFSVFGQEPEELRKLAREVADLRIVKQQAQNQLEALQDAHKRITDQDVEIANLRAQNKILLEQFASQNSRLSKLISMSIELKKQIELLNGKEKRLTQTFSEIRRFYQPPTHRAGNSEEPRDSSTLYILGLTYESGQGLEPTYAMKLFGIAADRGLAQAQYKFGLGHRLGKGVPKDDAEAAKWFRLAAEQGLAQAQSDLGDMYSDGEGVPQNHFEAVKWYRLAAKQGRVDAQFELGLKYANGEGVSQDAVEAYARISIAAEARPNAADYKASLNKIGNLLSPQQLVAAKKRVIELLNQLTLR